MRLRLNLFLTIDDVTKQLFCFPWVDTTSCTMDFMLAFLVCLQLLQLLHEATALDVERGNLRGSDSKCIIQGSGNTQNMIVTGDDFTLLNVKVQGG
jgi:hypothetical protein